MEKTHTRPIPEDEETRAGAITRSVTIMFTLYQTCVRNSDRARVRTHLLTFRLFSTKCAKTQRARQKRRRINGLRRDPQWRAWCPGHKKTQSVGENRKRRQRLLASPVGIRVDSADWASRASAQAGQLWPLGLFHPAELDLDPLSFAAIVRARRVVLRRLSEPNQRRS
jgi:hypothetical protein